MEALHDIWTMHPHGECLHLWGLKWIHALLVAIGFCSMGPAVGGFGSDRQRLLTDDNSDWMSRAVMLSIAWNSPLQILATGVEMRATGQMREDLSVISYYKCCLLQASSALLEPPVCRKEGARPWNQKRHFERSLQTARLHQKPIPYPSGGQSQAMVASCTEAPPTHDTSMEAFQKYF